MNWFINSAGSRLAFAFLRLRRPPVALLPPSGEVCLDEFAWDTGKD